MKYIKWMFFCYAIDGIKGLALIAIVLYHCVQQKMPGGFYGVDVFFTVSGFLIAISLFRSLSATGSLNLRRYIPRRLVRLYPALLLLIPVIVSVCWLTERDLLVAIRNQVITVLFGCYNWYAIAGGQSYFEQTHFSIGTPSPHKGAPTVRRRMVSETVSLPSRGTFHLSLTVLVRYRSDRNI